MKKRFFAGLVFFVVVGIFSCLCFAGTLAQEKGRSIEMPAGIIVNSWEHNEK